MGLLPIGQQPARHLALCPDRSICKTIKMPRLKAATLSLRIEPQLKAAAERAAADDGQSLTSLIENLLSDYLRQKGYLRPR
jgi:hypothetical protein